ncbi:signal peptidase [Paraburkholderia sp. D15]|uniref:signal peptidase n=1 Tax=Paraburkholderia sp. D15 TaxID=2880218 RepID=UPI00247A172C|nr:signal peptidase [Paraburkholderia sp. D15]WGS49054.1 signal peptidase [Paraburkholderia sp. D15]WKF56945.1 hypothetical protein HUO10_001417 [Paraburkholderia busanensis]
MKTTYLAAALTAASLTLAGCATQVTQVPLNAAGGQSGGGPVHLGAPSKPNADGAQPADSVQVYFGRQDHPAVTSRLGDVSFSVRIARKVATPEGACHEALAEAVRKLRAAALERKANAVIDVSTRFHSTETDSSTDFTCGVSPSAAAVAVKGQLVVLGNN